MLSDNNANDANANADADSPIRVVITPSQSSYFAGELFSVTITFTNISPPNSFYPYLHYSGAHSHAPTPAPTTPVSGNAPWNAPASTSGTTPRTASSFKHKRGSHSISSAPLARPPTSPGVSSRSVVVPESGNVVSARASWWNRGLGLVDNSTFSIPPNPSLPHLENYLGIIRRELILYAYAQLSGWMTLLPSYVCLPVGSSSSDNISHPSGVDEQRQSYAMKRLRAKLAKKTVIGGGSMDLTPSLARVKGETDEADENADIDPEVPLPMFESQPSMLAIDLSLAPGESKTYTYSMTLPSVLPPTFKGRCIKFSYEFSVGVCRAGVGVGFGTAENGSVMAAPSPSLASGSGVSRVMKVPIRVYNLVTVGSVPRPYDLLWPIGRRIRDQGMVVDGIQTTAAAERESEEKEGSVDELRDYARKVLAGRIKKSDEEAELDENVKIGCREAVEIITRNPRKVSYDVSKDGVKVAVLTFTKSAYRLGETVLGVVEFNERRGRARVLQMSAMLEVHEKLPSSLCASSSEAMTRVLAEQHQSLVMSVLRTTFSLDIPSDAAPAFQVGIEGETGDGGLEWRVRLSFLVVIAKEDVSIGTETVNIKGMVRDGCRGEWGSSWRASEGMAPLQKVDHPKDSGSRRGWAWYFASAILSPPSTEEDTLSDLDEYDGIKANLEGGVGRGVSYGGGESGWKVMSTEVVEFTVPVAIWAGNTAFKAVSVVFDL